MIASRARRGVGLGVVLTALLVLTGCLADDVRYLASDELDRARDELLHVLGLGARPHRRDDFVRLR